MLSINLLKSDVLAWNKERMGSIEIPSLCGANLRGADLRGADLRAADLRDADLYGADLYGANLYGADLYGADLYAANLYAADLRDANLYGANLYAADLRDANLRDANLYAADLSDASLSAFQIPDGDLVAWGKKNKVLVRLRIPYRARRTACLVNRKCRAEFAYVEWTKTGKPVRVKNEFGETIYTPGDHVYPDSYNDDIRLDCTHGIHFFLTRKEAEEWN